MTEILNTLKDIVLPIIITVLTVWLPWRFKKSDEKHRKQTNQLQQAYDKQRAKDAESIGRIYNENWEILHALGASMVFIVMPHPRISNLFISIKHLVKRKGVESVESEATQYVPMGDVARLTGMLINEEFWHRLDTEAKDNRAQALMMTYGIKNAYGHKLTNSDGVWVGAVVACNTDTELTNCEIRETMERAAKIIAPILPDIPHTQK